MMSVLMKWYMTNPAREKILIWVFISAIISVFLGLFLCKDNKTIILGIILFFLGCILGILSVLFFIGLIFSGPIR